VETVLKTRIVRIGNSRGVRIPKVWLEQTKLGEDVELALRPDQVVIRRARHPRQNWEEQFRDMAEAGDDRLLDVGIATQWDRDEWEW